MTIGVIRPPKGEVTYASGRAIIRSGENTAEAARQARIATAAASSVAMGIATADPVGQPSIDTFTALGRNAYSMVEAGGQNNYVKWSIPNRVSSQPLTIAYRILLTSGAAPQVRLEYSDGTFSALTALTSDGAVHYVTITPDADKTAVKVEFRTIGNSVHTASAIIEDGASAEAVGGRLSGVAGLAWRNGIDAAAAQAEIKTARGSKATLGERLDTFDTRFKIGIASGPPTVLVAYDTLTQAADSWNDWYFKKNGSGSTSNQAIPIPVQAEGTTFSVLYRFRGVNGGGATGATARIRTRSTVASGSTQGTLQNSINDGRWHLIQFTVAAGKPVDTLLVGHNDAAEGYATVYVFGGTDIEAIARTLPPVPALLLRQLVLGSQNPFANRRLVCFGDSITDSYGIPDLVKERLGLAAVSNFGIGGSGATANGSMAAFSAARFAQAIAGNDYTTIRAAAVAWDASNGTAITAKMDAAAALDWSLVDYITLMIGTNDWGNAIATIGAGDSVDETTYCGALNLFLAAMQTKAPQARFVLFTPFYRDRLLDGDGLNSDENANSAGLWLRDDFADAMIAVAERNNVAVVDMYRTSGINKRTAGTLLNTPVSPGLHPSSPVGTSRVADLQVGGLRRFWG